MTRLHTPVRGCGARLALAVPFLHSSPDCPSNGTDTPRTSNAVYRIFAHQSHNLYQLPIEMAILKGPGEPKSYDGTYPAISPPSLTASAHALTYRHGHGSQPASPYHAAGH